MVLRITLPFILSAQCYTTANTAILSIWAALLVMTEKFNSRLLKWK